MPGTGKTATVHEVLREMRVHQENGVSCALSFLSRGAHFQFQRVPPFRYVEVNGMKVVDSQHTYTLLWKAISGARLPTAQALDHLVEYFSRASVKKCCCVLLLDEVDEIASRHISVLYNLLEWPRQPSSRLIVVGIANTMDLLERMLPRLVSRAGTK